MLRRFQVKNFRSIENETVLLEPLSVFVGPNGSGKTNLLRAIELFGDLLFAGSVEPALEDAWDTLSYRGAGGTRTTLQLGGQVRVPYRWPDEPDRVGALVVDATIGLKHIGGDDDVVAQTETISLHRTRTRNRKSTLSVAVDRKGSVRIQPGDDPSLWEAAVSGMFLSTRAKESPTADVVRSLASRVSPEGASSRGDIDDPHSLKINRIFGNATWFRSALIPRLRVRRYRLETASLRGHSWGVPPARGQLGLSGDGLPEVVDRLRRDGQLDQILRSMQQVLPRLESVATERRGSQRGLIFRERGLKRPLPDSAVSDGTLHTLALLAALTPDRRVLASRSGRIVVLEELENAVHPWAIGAVLRAAQEATSQHRQQVLISTHSPVVIDSTPVDSLYVVEHEGPSTTVVRAKAIRAELRSRLARSGMSLGEVWLDGLLGGVPIAR